MFGGTVVFECCYGLVVSDVELWLESFCFQFRKDAVESLDDGLTGKIFGRPDEDCVQCVIVGHKKY